MKRSAQKNLQNFVRRTVKPLAGCFSVVYGLLEMPFVGEERLAYPKSCIYNTIIFFLLSVFADVFFIDWQRECNMTRIFYNKRLFTALNNMWIFEKTQFRER